MWKPDRISVLLAGECIIEGMPRCPACRAQISLMRAAAGRQFFCPVCGHGVRLRRRYFRVLGFLSALVSGLVAYALGARGDALLTFTFIGMFPIQFVMIVITTYLFPPDIESTGDFRGILYGPPGEAISPSVTDEAQARSNEARSSEKNGKAAVIHVAPDRWTLEGIVISAFFAFVAIGMVWLTAAPFVYRALPRLAATKYGPRGFPVTVGIRQDRLRITNGSTESWTCRTELGFGRPYISIFDVEAHQTHDALYAGFQKDYRDVGTEAALYSRAREKIVLTCGGVSASHFAIF